jgi:hypothetical protein
VRHAEYEKNLKNYFFIYLILFYFSLETFQSHQGYSIAVMDDGYAAAQWD